MLYQTLVYQYLIIVEKYHLQYSIKLNILHLMDKNAFTTYLKSSSTCTHSFNNIPKQK